MSTMNVHVVNPLTTDDECTCHIYNFDRTLSVDAIRFEDTVWREIFVGQNFWVFCGFPSDRKNFTQNANHTLFL